MKTKATFLMVLLTFLMITGSGKELSGSILSNDPPTGNVNSGFTLIRRDNNISIYSKWIPVNETRSSRQLKAEFTIDCPAENVVLILRDEKSYLKWMKATRACYRIKTLNSNQWYSYVQFSVPWPLNNQDCILKYEIRTFEELSRTEITLVSTPDFLKPNKGIERISHMEGLWVITQTRPGKTRVEYYVCSKQVPKYPTWITAPLIEKNLLKTMNALRDAVINGLK